MQKPWSIIFAATITFIIWKIFFSKPSAKQTTPPFLPEWLEILADNNEPLVRGKRLATLPIKDYGLGSCIMVGVLMVEHSPELANAIRLHCHGIWLDENRVLARVLARPGGGERSDENLIVGLFAVTGDERIKLEAWLAENEAQSIDVCVELSSTSIGLMEATEIREEFEMFWRQHLQTR